MEEQKLSFETIKSAIEKLDADRIVYPGIKLVKSDALTGTQVLIKSGDKVYYSPNIKNVEAMVIMDEFNCWEEKPVNNKLWSKR